MEEKPKSPIGWGFIIIVGGISLVLDGLTLIPVVGTFLGPIYFAAFSFYLWKIGKGFLNARRLATSAISTVAEIIPVIQEFPAIFLGTAVIFALLKFEEKTGIGVTSLAKKGHHLNHGDTRPPTPSRPPPRYSDGVGRPTGTSQPANIIKVDFGDRYAEEEDLQKAA